MRNTLLIVAAIAAIIAAIVLVSKPYQQPPLEQAPQGTDTSRVEQTIQPQEKWAGYTVRKVIVEGVEYNLLVADTTEKAQTGLMNVTDISPYDGMVFIFPEVAPRSFWNQNTLMDLDLYWMRDDVVVGKSELPAITTSKEIVTVSSPEPVNMVVELPQKK